MRWLARPTRCSSRLTPLGAPTCITWSTPPQSMPRSSEEVATTARSRPAAIAASTRRRCSALQAAVVDGDRQGGVVQLPQFLEQQLGLGAGVDEDDGHAGGADARQDLAARRPGPCGPDQGSRPSGRIMAISGGAPSATSIDSTSRRCRRARRRRPARPGARRWRTARSRRAAGARRAEPGEAERQAGRRAWCRPARAPRPSRSRARAANMRRRVGQGEQHGEAFGRGQQDVAAASARWRRRSVGGGVAGAGLDGDGQRHVRDRAGQVARDVGGQRLQRADIERVQAGARGRRRGRPGWAGSRPASCRRRWGRPAARCARPRRPPAARNWCGRGVQPWRANQWQRVPVMFRSCPR